MIVDSFRPFMVVKCRVRSTSKACCCWNKKKKNIWLKIVKNFVISISIFIFFFEYQNVDQMCTMLFTNGTQQNIQRKKKLWTKKAATVALKWPLICIVPLLKLPQNSSHSCNANWIMVERIRRNSIFRRGRGIVRNNNNVVNDNDDYVGLVLFSFRLFPFGS